MAMHAHQAAWPLRAACTVLFEGVSPANAVSADTQVSGVPGPFALLRHVGVQHIFPAGLR